MKLTLLTISLFLGLTAVAADNAQQAPQPQAPATTVAPANGLTPEEEVIPCPLPGEPASNCPVPREPEVTEAGTGATPGGNVHTVVDLGLLLSSPKGNALYDANNQTLPTPLLPGPVRDEK